MKPEVLQLKDGTYLVLHASTASITHYAFTGMFFGAKLGEHVFSGMKSVRKLRKEMKAWAKELEATMK